MLVQSPDYLHGVNSQSKISIQVFTLKSFYLLSNFSPRYHSNPPSQHHLSFTENWPTVRTGPPKHVTAQVWTHAHPWTHHHKKQVCFSIPKHPIHPPAAADWRASSRMFYSQKRTDAGFPTSPHSATGLETPLGGAYADVTLFLAEKTFMVRTDWLLAYRLWMDGDFCWGWAIAREAALHVLPLPHMLRWPPAQALLLCVQSGLCSHQRGQWGSLGPRA